MQLEDDVASEEGFIKVSGIPHSWRMTERSLVFCTILLYATNLSSAILEAFWISNSEEILRYVADMREARSLATHPALHFPVRATEPQLATGDVSLTVTLVHSV